MRTHYLPQKYLSRFSIQPDAPIVCQYDRHTNRFKTLTVKAVGVFTDWFSELTENQLSKIEGAALDPMENLVDLHQQLTDDERKAVIKYIASMIQRIPAGREKALLLLNESYEFLKNNPEFVQQETGIPPSVSASHLARYEVDGTREQMIEVDSKLILELPQVEDALENMQWRVLLAKNGQCFLTSDAPVYWDQAAGIGKAGADLTFPLSNKAVLYFSNERSSSEIEFTEVSERIHTQLNRRAVYNSKRFVFSPTDGRWVKLMAQQRTRPIPRLSNVAPR